MKFKNTSCGTIMFPLKENEAITNGAVYEIVSGKAQKVTTTPTGALIGVCQGGDKLEKGKIMLDIDPTSIFKETYESKPTVGEAVLGCKLVIAVDEVNKTFEYVLRKI